MNTESSLTLSDKSSKTELNDNKNNYQLEIYGIVTKTLLLSGQNQVSKPEKVAMAHVWTETLIEIIPIDELQNAFKKAIELHKGEYPLNAFSLKNAWEEIKKTDIIKRHQHEDTLDWIERQNKEFAALGLPLITECKPSGFTHQNAEFN